VMAAAPQVELAVGAWRIKSLISEWVSLQQ
jgi:hypothetical protein